MNKDEIKAGDLVRIISNDYNNILHCGYYKDFTIGKVFEVGVVGYRWVYPTDETNNWAIDIRSVEKYNKHEIVRNIIADL